MCDVRSEIVESLFECRAEIRYALACPLTAKVFSPSQTERLERVLEQMEGIQNAIEALVTALVKNYGT